MDLVTSTYVSRVGRLGNSLLQIATTLAYGLKHNKKPVFTKWNYQDYISLDLIPEETQPRWNRVAGYDLIFQPLDYAEGDVDLHGHFVSQKYFSDYRDEILKIIKLKNEHDDYVNVKYYIVLQYNTCSVHVRRNDYLQEEQKNYHGVLPLEYYKKAVSFFPADTYFIICSDDMDWCKKNLYFLKGMYVENEKDIIDLFIMSKCKNNIIANSTFSFWSAHLNQNQNKKVIAPDNFFVSGHDKDLYPTNWITV